MGSSGGCSNGEAYFVVNIVTAARLIHPHPHPARHRTAVMTHLTHHRTAVTILTTKYASPLLQPPLLPHSQWLTTADLGFGSQQLDCTLPATRQSVRSTGSNRGCPTQIKSDCSLMNGENESNICLRKFLNQQ